MRLNRVAGSSVAITRHKSTVLSQHQSSEEEYSGCSRLSDIVLLQQLLLLIHSFIHSPTIVRACMRGHEVIIHYYYY